MSTGIYAIKNLVNNHWYIGQSVDVEKRKSKHFSNLRKGKHDNNHLQNSFNKYGEDAFTFEILFECPKDKLTHYEQIMVTHCIHATYNIRRECVDTQAGLHWELSEETKQRMSIAQKGHSTSEGTKQKISIASKGKSMSEEAKQKMSLAKMGHPTSDETKQKISLAIKGKKLNPLTGRFENQTHQIGKDY